MAFFNKKKLKLSKSERLYEPEEESVLSKLTRFNVFVIIAVVAVLAVVLVILAMNFGNNSLKGFVSASSKSFDSGSFDYHIEAGMNDKKMMEYTGSFELDLSEKTMSSCYHAVYEDYEYDAVLLSENEVAYRGNYYGGKWSVEDYTNKALDFYDFYTDYRKYEFDAGAAVRFTEKTKTYSATQLDIAINDIISDLSTRSSMKNILHQQITQSGGNTTITYNVEMDDVFDIIVSHIGSAYTSANEFSSFKERVEKSKANLEKAETVISYTTDSKGHLTEITINYKVDSQEYYINAELSNFSNAKVEIPDGFTEAASLE
ncbi:MAG: hypothetical protein IKB73_06920 [Ruminococcus sp.]|nr:hypothetical protein [Ruminococcus sp.]